MTLRWLFPLLLLVFVAAAKKNPPATVRFHSETNARGENDFAMQATLQYPPRQVYLGRVPDISERNIEAIFPFQAADGTMGCAFQLDSSGRLALSTLSVDRRGGSLVAFVGRRQVIDMLIDRQITDGIVTIPRGLSPEEIALLQKHFKTMGQEKGKKKKA